MGKYKAKKVVYNIKTKETSIATTPSTVINTNKLEKEEEIIRFDSQFEFSVYQLILEKFKEDKVLIHKTYSLNESFFVKSLNYQNKFSNFTDLLKFNPDFTIINNLNDDLTLHKCKLIIEAKGMLTRDYILKLYIFLQFFPGLASKYVVVFSNNNYAKSQSFKRLINQFGFTVLTTNQLKDYLIRQN